jgi:2'-5' RNA ligase
MMRLFIALPLPGNVEGKLGEISKLLKHQGGKVRWVPPENIHMTVRFLGDTDEATVPKLTQLIDRVAAEFGPAEVTINRLGGFPNLRRPRVIWAGLAESEDVERLGKMARQIELAVRQLRFEKDSKGFKPHLTLGRVKDPRDLRALTSYMEEYRFEPISIHIDRLVLFKSTLTPQGAVYERLHEAVLGEERLGG